MMKKQSNPVHKSTKICFVALGAYPLLAGKKVKNIIGPDVHQVILAKELIKHDFEASFITYSEGEVHIEDVNSIKIIQIHEAVYRLKILNIVLKVVRIWNAMKMANADIYFHAGNVVGPVSLFCRVLKKKFIYEIASDALVNKNLIIRKIKDFSRSKFSIGTFGNWLDIKLADAIIVQSVYQKKMLKKNFDTDGFVIKMPFPLTKRGFHEKVNPPIVLWVGAMAEVKQPDLFVKLAEILSEAKFQMIGGHSGNQKLYDRIKENSKRVPNFDYFGVIPFNEVNGYFSRAAILVNTSMFEGFPHAFIQAWEHYVPVVSLNADPDGLICENKMGFHSKTFNQLVEDVKTLLKNKALIEEMSVNGRRYVEREHDITNNIKEYIGVFEHV